jgi:predicted CoA-binding protein
MSTVEQRPHEAAQDILRERRPVLDAMFAPKAVALIGATEAKGSVGRTVLENLRKNDFGGVIYPVNPKRESVLGIKTFSRIDDVREKVDLAIIAMPASTVPGVVAECVKNLLGVYDIPIVETHIASSADEAVAIAEKLGGTVVLKLHSEAITHKSDVGGVKLNLHGAAAVRRAFHEIEVAVSPFPATTRATVNDRAGAISSASPSSRWSRTRGAISSSAARPIRSLARCCCLARAACSSRFSKTARSACRRSTRCSRGG